MIVDVVGGTYREYCFEPHWQETFGSGLRSVFVISALNPVDRITFHTFADARTSKYLDSLKGTFSNLEIEWKQISETPLFYYDYPLATPSITPRPDTFELSEIVISEKRECILCYGFIEGRSKFTAKKVVYDPQSPANPIPFSKTGSTADQLAVIINFKEAQKICGTGDIQTIKKFFLEAEKAEILILKMGAKGALVFDQHGEYEIPVFKTESVWPIGSGDVFSAVFFYRWVTGSKIVEAANFASRTTAAYVNTRGFDFQNASGQVLPLHIKKIPTGTIYLAGPFFSFTERWLVEQIKNALEGMGLKVFSPWHDVGHGLAHDVVELDIKGLIGSQLVLAIVDGLDSGTLFEIGYAVAKGIPVIAYVQKENKDSIKMLEGTNCIIIDDLSTAIYKSFWVLAENE